MDTIGVGGRSIWVGSRADPPLPPPSRGGIEADVAVVGAGIVGTTVAHLLRRRGLDVVLIEALRVGEQTTGGSSAKVTSQHSLIYRWLADHYDDVLAREYGAANEWAIRDMAARVAELGIDCAWEERAAYTYSLDANRVDDLRAEAELASRLGLPARFTADVPLPFETAGAVVFDRQAQFDPLAYVRGVRAAFEREGGSVVEGVRVTDLEDHGGTVTLTTTHGPVVARHVVVATALPFLNDGGYFAFAPPKAHIALAARVPAQPVDGMFISIDDPTRSIRAARHDGADWVMLIGPAFTPGEIDTLAALDDLESFARRHFAVDQVEYRWWNMDYYASDRVPYIGRLHRNTERVFVATGFSGWGITNGNVAANILADAVYGTPNRWASMFDSTRRSPETDSSPLTSLGRVMSGGIEVAKNLASRILPGDSIDLAALAPGDGRIVDVDGQRVAVARDHGGALHAVSALCTHMGCELGWNGVAQSWDCGCHGSCFALDGAVLRGPAVHPLEAKPSVEARSREETHSS